MHWDLHCTIYMLIRIALHSVLHMVRRVVCSQLVYLDSQSR